MTPDTFELSDRIAHDVNGGSMFQVFCPTHGSRVLLGPRRIEAVRETARGPLVVWRCYCGEQGTLLNDVSRAASTTAMSSDPLITAEAA